MNYATVNSAPPNMLLVGKHQNSPFEVLQALIS